MNKFKILTPSYNNSQWVEYNIASILNQTYSHWEVVYINDNSIDDTLQKVKSIVGDNDKFTIIDNDVNRGATYNYFENLNHVNDDDIVLHLDGDDWLIDETVLEKLNNLYTNTDCWMSYGGMVVWNGEDVSLPNPQNSPYHPFVHDYKYYRLDTWRASHLRTYRGFLLKAIDKKDLRDLVDDVYYWHATDLAFQYAAMEMCGKEKIQVVDFYTYVYNQHPTILNRTRQRESKDNSRYEIEIRNRKKYRTGINNGKLPLVNVIGDFRERNSVPKNFSFVYNQVKGEFDITLIQDYDCIKYVNGGFGEIPGIVAADIHEPPHLANHKVIYDFVFDNADKFDYIFTYDKKLLTLPNAIFRNGGYECVLNKNIHSLEHPLLADESLFDLYDKSKSVSFITSNKQITDLHVFRTNCVTQMQRDKLPVDIFGVGYNQIKRKLDALKDYKYSVAIENGIFENYFTEKILDCFLTGTIPIYKGCPNIHEFFNTDGIIFFNTYDDLKTIIMEIENGKYNVDQTILKENYEKALTFCYDNDRLFDKFIKPVLNENKV